MNRRSEETFGVRYTGWAALDRNPQEDSVEYICRGIAGTSGNKPARAAHAPTTIFPTDFLQDVQGENEPLPEL